MMQENSHKIHCTYDNLYDIISESECIDEDLFKSKINNLIEIGYIETSILDDSFIYTARTGLTWSDFKDIDDLIKKKILLHLVENPNTFFVLMNTQKGKMRIAALEMKKWGQNKEKKIVAFLIVSNDKTLADQSSDGILKTFERQKLKVFPLSSNSKVSLEHIKTYVDAYNNDTEEEYHMPLIIALANPKQNEKIVKLLHRIHRKVERNSKLRIGMIFDEADETYSRLRDKYFTIEGNDVSLSTYLVDNTMALHRLGFFTATDGNLLEDDYPECSNAYLYPIEIPQEDKEHYRAIHHEESIIHTVPFKSRESYNTYAMKILDNNKEHFMKPIVLQSGEICYRKTIINSNSQTKDMIDFAKQCNKKGMYCLVFNGVGVQLYINRKCVKIYKTKNKKFNELLFYIYKLFNLKDKPLIIIGRRKVDRGLGFHFCPKTNDEVKIEFEDHIVISKNREGLIWTDMIGGKIDDKNRASQKLGRLAGIIGNSPQYPGNTHYWTDENTAKIAKRHNTIVDVTNDMTACSLVQAVKKAETIVPKIPIVRDFEITELYNNFNDLKKHLRSILPIGNITKFNISNNTIKYRGTVKEIYSYIDRKQFLHLDINGGISKKVTKTSIVSRMMPVLHNNIQKWIGIYNKNACNL
jgi:hypothetical protein